MNKENILKLADIIAVQPWNNDYEDPLGFGMEHIFHTCGTPSCIAGFAIACAMAASKVVNVLPELVDRYDSRKAFRKMRVSKQIGWEDYAADWLGIPRFSERNQITIDLFTPTNVRWTTISPAIAATCLRNLAETGKVDWHAAINAHTPEDENDEQG